MALQAGQHAQQPLALQAIGAAEIQGLLRGFQRLGNLVGPWPQRIDSRHREKCLNGIALAELPNVLAGVGRRHGVRLQEQTDRGNGVDMTVTVKPMVGLCR